MKQCCWERVCRAGWSCRGFIALSMTASAAMPCLAGGGVPDYDFDWALIDHPQNPAYPGGPAVLDRPYAGRGSVSYEYRMSVTEVTSGQWLEFLNTVDRLDPNLAYEQIQPLQSGIGQLLGRPPGERFVLRGIPNAASLPCGGISFRAAAMYCNWLHNGKAPTLDAIATGAYETATFGWVGDLINGHFTDQLTRSAGAMFWIPSLDEWLKAVHFDPNKEGQGQPGWWNYPYRSDSPPISGLPGEPGAQTSADLEDGSVRDQVPLGSYPDARTAFGLLDASGGMSEILEEPISPPGDPPRARLVEGTFAGDGGPGFAEAVDVVWQPAGSDRPYSQHSFTGLRIAAAVPSPAASTVLLLGLFFRKKRK